MSAEDNIELITRVYDRDGWRCRHCGASVYKYGTPQLAHLVPQRKHNVRQYGKARIHHPANLAATCSLRCNAAVQLPPWRWDVHMSKIALAMSIEEDEG